MGWVRLSDDFYDHPKFTDITPLSIALWIVGMAYCNRNLTDGRVPVSAANRLCDFDGIAYETGGNEFMTAMEDDCTPLAIHDLLKVGLWHDDGHDCASCPQPGRRSYYVHDYLVYQPSAAEIKDTRENRSKAGKKGAASRWGGAGNG
jgi:hypothetical protein